MGRRSEEGLDHTLLQILKCRDVEKGEGQHGQITSSLRMTSPLESDINWGSWILSSGTPFSVPVCPSRPGNSLSSREATGCYWKQYGKHVLTVMHRDLI